MSSNSIPSQPSSPTTHFPIQRVTDAQAQNDVQKLLTLDVQKLFKRTDDLRNRIENLTTDVKHVEVSAEDSIAELMKRIEQRFDGIEKQQQVTADVIASVNEYVDSKRYTQVDHWMNSVDLRVDLANNRIDATNTLAENRLDRTERDLNYINGWVGALSHHLRELRNQVDDLARQVPANEARGNHSYDGDGDVDSSEWTSHHSDDGFRAAHARPSIPRTVIVAAVTAAPALVHAIAGAAGKLGGGIAGAMIGTAAGFMGLFGKSENARSFARHVEAGAHDGKKLMTLLPGKALDLHRWAGNRISDRVDSFMVWLGPDRAGASATGRKQV